VQGGAQTITLLGQLMGPPTGQLSVQVFTFVPQSMRQIAPAEQLSVQLLLRLPPHFSEQLAPLPQSIVPLFALSASAVHVEPLEQVKPQLLGPEQVKSHEQLEPHALLQLLPEVHDSRQQGRHDAAQSPLHVPDARSAGDPVARSLVPVARSFRWPARSVAPRAKSEPGGVTFSISKLHAASTRIEHRAARTITRNSTPIL
jgi:hypothetical protein